MAKQLVSDEGAFTSTQRKQINDNFNEVYTNVVVGTGGSALLAPERTFASLAGTGVVGMLANVSDSTVNTIGATVAGGGANHVLARFNGTNWTVAAL